jgi:transposase
MKNKAVTAVEKSKDEVIEEQKSLIVEHELTIKKLTNELIALRRKLFGSKSERNIPEDPNQLKLDFEGGVETLPEEAAQPVEVVVAEHTRKQQDKKQPVREPIPEHLRREVIIVEPANIPDGAVRIGEVVTEKMEYLPGEVYVKRTVRPKYALPKNEGIVVADLPTQVLPKSNAGASLLAYLIVGKFMDHLPFYRIIEILKRANVKIAPSTVNGWFSDTVDLLNPLYDCLKKEVLSSDYLQMDESSIPVMDKDKPGSTRKGYHWIVRSPMQNQLFFCYQQGSRGQKVVIDLLRDFKGALQSDGYGAYSIYENKKNVLLLGCMAHARRKFEEALKEDRPRAEYALLLMRELYEIERQMQEEELSFADIEKFRKEKSYPILQKLEQWLLDNKGKVLPKGLISKAISYTYDIFPRLARYVIDGRYKIDNNGAENGIRPMALGRKNYLFCGNDDAAKKAAIVYSLLGSCKLANVNPMAWLTDVLTRLPDHQANKLTELLPKNWTPITQPNS